MRDSNGTITRMGRIQPWYHRTAERCVAITLSKDQCIYSARFEDYSGRVVLCKIHADMADPSEVKLRPIRARLVALR